MVNKYELERQVLLNEYEKELDALDRERSISNLDNATYWKRYKEVVDKFSKAVKDIDSAERAAETLLLAKEGRNSNRPEYRYADLCAQIKSEKMSQLILDLAAIPSDNINDKISIKDPFYLHKKDPISVFETWWTEFLSFPDDLPSISEIRQFVDSISINKYGYICRSFDSFQATTSKSDNVPASREKEITEEDIAKYFKSKITKSSRQRKKELEDAKLRKIQARSPLLAGSAKKMLKERKRKSNEYRNERLYESYCAVVDAYSPPPELADLLYEHIRKVAIPKGICHIDEYQHMLEQFLRMVTDPMERLCVVDKSIRKGWRILSNGTF